MRNWTCFFRGHKFEAFTRLIWLGDEHRKCYETRCRRCSAETWTYLYEPCTISDYWWHLRVWWVWFIDKPHRKKDDDQTLPF